MEIYSKIRHRIYKTDASKFPPCCVEISQKTRSVKLKFKFQQQVNDNDIIVNIDDLSPTVVQICEQIFKLTTTEGLHRIVDALSILSKEMFTKAFTLKTLPHF